MWQASPGPTGYGQFFIRRGMPPQKAHRVAWTLSRGPLPSDINVLHSCDTPGCVNPAHLFLGTHADNVADKERKGRGMKGGTHPQARLDAESVSMLREAYARGEPIKQIAEAFGVAQPTAHNAITGVTWAHIKSPPPVPPRRRTGAPR